MPKLLYITTNLQGSGGVSRVLSVKLNYLIETYGYTIHVITTNNKFDAFFYEFNDHIVFHKIDIKDLGLQYLLKYKRMLQNMVDDVQPDIVINCDNGLKGALLPYLINTNASLIYEMHSSKDMVYDKRIDRLKFKLANYLVKKTIEKYICFVVLTNSHASEWKSKITTVIHNPITISPPVFKSNKEKTILAVGRFSKEKGYERLFHIWSKISSIHPEWKLEIYGLGHKEKYSVLLQEFNKDNTIALKDAVSDIEKVYAKASIFVNTSFSEAFPLAMVEAMYYGLPVIAFETIGARQLIINEENGNLVTQNDESDFIKKMKVLMNNEEKLRLMSSNAIQSVKKYNLDVIMKQWHQLFQSLG